MDLKSQLRTTPKYIEILKNSGISSLKDFFLYIPRDYEDRTEIKTLKDIVFDNTKQQVKGIIIEKKLIQTRGGKQLGQITFEDEVGNIGKISFMRGLYALSKVYKGNWYLIIGKPQQDGQSVHFWHPEFVSTQDGGTDEKGLYPIYSELLGIKPKWFAQKIKDNFDKINGLFGETYPKEFLKEFDLFTKEQTIKNLHYPTDTTSLKKAQYRYFFDKLIKIQITGLLNKLEYSESYETIQEQPDWEIIKEFLSKLEFELTQAQKKAIKNIIEDYYGNNPMMRLLQGDVGSGKTIVATCAIYYLIKKFGGQCAFLSPTEVLAKQHFLNLSKLLLPLGINTQLLTGSTTAKNKEIIKQNLVQGKINLIIGTHAIIQKDVDFHNLKLTVIDEQHKFGVLQRSFFKQFNSPHILQMTATPIPRSLALAFFGEFDVSIINQMPLGRKPIQTKLITNSEYGKLKQWIITKIQNGQQVYIVVPLVEESENLDEVQSVNLEFEQTEALFPELRGQIGLLHGKLRPAEKENQMNLFKEGKNKILVSTTVIEVGVDVKSATVMIIKNSERFGLSQLHQLRGRVGRNSLQSYCFLETKKKTGPTYERLKAMEETSDGFKLSEIDMKNRGTGEILGVKQSGDTDIPINILPDINFLERVQNGAKWLINYYEEKGKLKEFKDKFLSEDGAILA